MSAEEMLSVSLTLKLGQGEISTHDLQQGKGLTCINTSCSSCVVVAFS